MTGRLCCNRPVLRPSDSGLGDFTLGVFVEILELSFALEQ